MFSPSRCTVFTTLVPYFILDQPYCSPSLIYEILIRLGESDPSPDAGPQRLIVFTNLEVRCAPIVRRILKSTWSLSISQSKGRNLLPYFSQALSQAGARRDRSAFRSRVPATNSPFLRRYCSLHHSPLDVSASLMASSSENAADHYRLPTDARPKLYDLTIRTDLEKEKFTGFVKIECVQRLSRVFRSSCSSLHTTASKS